MIDKEKLYQLAAKAEACEKKDSILGAGNMEDLISLYKQNIDFCLSENFPSNEYLAENIDDDILAKYGIFLNKQNVISRNGDFVVLLGKSKLQMEVDGYNVSQIFIKEESSAVIFTKDHAFVVVDCFDSQLTIEAEGNSKVLVNAYDNAVVYPVQMDNAAIKVVRKRKERTGGNI